MIARLAVVTLVIVVGVCGTVVAIRAREGDPVFIEQQTRLRPLSSTAVEAVVRTAPVLNGKPGTRATCRAMGHGELRNPWRCDIGYPSGRSFRFLVTVGANGYYVGRRPPSRGGGSIRGCCVNVFNR